MDRKFLQKLLRYLTLKKANKPFANQSLSFSFETNFAMVFVRGNAGVPRGMKNMKWQMDQNKRLNGFLNRKVTVKYRFQL